MKRRLMFSLVILTSLTAAHADTCGDLPSPVTIKSRIEAAPDRESFLKIFNMRLGSKASPEWTCFLDKVSRGDESYGGALTAMSKKPFWLASSEVTEALSQALAVKPAFVLKIIAASANPERSTEVICQIDLPYGITRKKADAALAQLQTSLSTVTDASLTGQREGCLESLDTHLTEWKTLHQGAADHGDE